MPKSSILLVLLIIVIPSHAIPSIRLEMAEGIYTCFLENFELLSTFPSDFQHISGLTNKDVRIIFANESQTIALFPINIFTYFHNILKVRINNANIELLDKPFFNCEMLYDVDLMYNSIRNVPSGIFTSCKAMLSIKFGFNKITSVDEKAFFGMPRINSLEFDNNFLRSVPEKLLSELPNLTRLRLNENFITEFPANLFVNNPHLWFLAMENNPVNDNLNEDLLRNQKSLWILYISVYNLTEIPLNLLRNTTILRSLGAGFNKLKRVRSGVLSNCRGLGTVEFYNNQIENIDNDAFAGLEDLEYIRLEFNQLKFLNIKIFKHLKALAFLNVEGNPLIAISYDFKDQLPALTDFSVTEELFETYKAEIIQCEYSVSVTHGYTCDIIDSRISSHKIAIDTVDQQENVNAVKFSVEYPIVPDDIFKTFKAIKVADLTAIGLPASVRSTFGNLMSCADPCDTLEVIIFDHNDYEYIVDGVFSYTSFHTLSMRHNKITSVTGDIFINVRNGQEVDLSFNKIVTFDAFYGFVNLKLSNNPLVVSLERIPTLPDGGSQVKNLWIDSYSGDLKSGTVEKSAIYNILTVKKLVMSNRRIKSISEVNFNGLIEELDISSNEIREVNFKPVIGLQKLKVLDMSRNLMTKVAERNFERIKELEVLDLSDNEITELDEDSFKNALKLKRLHLDGNRLKILWSKSFYGPEELTILTISRNNLRVLQESCFEAIPMLEELDLSENSLVYLDQSSFGPSNSLKLLNLSKNNIQFTSTSFRDSTIVILNQTTCRNLADCPEPLKISCHFFRNLNSQYECAINAATVSNKTAAHFVDGSHIGSENSGTVQAITAGPDSILAFIPNVIFQEFWNLKVLSIRGARINFLNPFFNCSELLDVDLQGNDLSTIFDDIFASCGRIERLNIEQNMIVSIHDESFMNLRNLLRFSAGNNDIRRISASLFDGNEQLEVIQINSNKITEIDGKTFGLLRNLKELRLHSNPIEELPAGLLESVVKLEVLEIHNLNLSNGISEDFFKHNRNLREISMMKNKIEKIGESLFKFLENLKVLDMKNCKIKEIHENSFENLRNLKVLNLQLNFIEKIEPKMVENLGHLQELLISDSNISSIPSLENANNLQILKIDGNKLENLPENFLKNSQNLLHFHGNKNFLTELDENLFQDCTNLQFLNLEDNKITNLNPKTFENLKNLQIFNLNYNKISEIPENFFQNMPNLSQILMHDNLIPNFPPQIFKNLRNLTKIDFSMNFLTILKSSSFENSENFEKFQEIFLSDNKIASIEPQTFHFLPNLKVLNLKNNEIKTLSSSFFRELNGTKVNFMHEIDISNNELSKISSDFFEKVILSRFYATGNICVDDNFYSPNFNNSEVLEGFANCRAVVLNCVIEEVVGGGQEVSIYANNQEKVSNFGLGIGNFADDFENFGNLPSNFENGWQNFTEIGKLNSQDSLLSTLKCNLKATLSVEQEKFQFEVHVGENSKESVKIVEFVYSDLSFFPQALFQEFENLETLIIKNSNLKSLKKLEKCEKLKFLTLDEENGVDLGDRNLINCKNLRLISVTNSVVSKIGHAFHDLTNLQELRLQNSKILNLKFFIPNSVEILKMKGNLLKINQETFKNLPNLKEICVGNFEGLKMLNFEDFQKVDDFRDFQKIKDFDNFQKIQNFENFQKIQNFENFQNVENFEDFQEIQNFEDFQKIQNFDNFQKFDNFENFQKTVGFENCAKNSFENLKNLEILDISNRAIENENFPNFLANFNNLKTLRCSNNHLTELNEELFKNLTLLLELNLESNDISTIKSFTFRTLSKLKILNLKNPALNSGRISKIEENAFYGLKSLSVLQLDNNLIPKISTKDFESLENLKFLSLFGNKIEKIEPGAFLMLKNLIELDLSENFFIENLHFDIFVDLGSLEVLKLQNSNLKVLPSSLNLLKNLKFLDISGNRLTNFLFSNIFDNLKILDISRNQIVAVNPKIFNGNISVYVNFNPCSLNSKNFEKCFENFENFNFCELVSHPKYEKACKLTELTQNSALKSEISYIFNKNKKLNLEIYEIFEIYTNLTQIDLWKSSIRNFYGIMSCKNLKIFDLRLNLIEKILENSFFECENLEKLIFMGNKIKFLHKNGLKNLKNLQFLDLSGNEIENIEPGVFDGNFKLKVLNLNFNKIKKISSDLLKNLESLKILKLSNNFLMKIGNFLSKNVQIREIFLNSNNLTEISAQFFENLKVLNYLNLEKNNLNKIDLTRLSSKFLDYLDISHNNLSTILIDFAKFPYLRVLVAAKNACVNENFEEFGPETVNKFKKCPEVAIKDEL